MQENDKARHDRWQDQVKSELREKTPTFSHATPEGFEQKRLYTRQDTTNLPFTLTYPGQAPYTRGPRATMYTGRPWTIRQYAGFSTAEESNKFYRANLASGQKGLSVAFDLATHRGYDSDHERVTGDVGKAGVAIDSVEDMKILFDGIPLDQMSVSMTMNGAVLPILAAYVVAAEEQGVAQDQLSGTIQNDILKEYLVRNTYIYPPEPSMRIVGDIIAYTANHMPRFNSISISGYHIQEAGADSALELAFTLANGIEYVKSALKRGLAIDDFAPRLSFFFGIGMNFFTEIAKLRAARTLWHELISQYNPKNPKSSMLRTHCQTSGYTLTEQDPYNNIIRTTIEAMAAVLGGTQSLHTNSFDEAIGLPTAFSARIARNTQLILQHETDITHTIDPFGGSYMMESLTYELMLRTKEIHSEIEQQGGIIHAIDSGWAKQKIEEAATKRQTKIDQGEEIIVGVNRYQTEEKSPIEHLKIDADDVREKQLHRLQKLKKNRNDKNVRKALEALKEGARNEDNLLKLAIDAMRVRATVGEVSAALKECFGEYHAPSKAVTGVYSKAFQDDTTWQMIRQKIQYFAEKEGRQPRILIVKLGQDGHDRGAKVIASGFADMGFDVDIGSLFQTPEEAVKQAIENDVHVIGVSSQAAAHRSTVPALFQKLKEADAREIKIVVGGIIPEIDYDYLKANGVAAIFGPGTPITTAGLETINVLLADQK